MAVDILIDYFYFVKKISTLAEIKRKIVDQLVNTLNSIDAAHLITYSDIENLADWILDPTAYKDDKREKGRFVNELISSLKTPEGAPGYPSERDLEGFGTGED